MTSTTATRWATSLRRRSRMSSATATSSTTSRGAARSSTTPSPLSPTSVCVSWRTTTTPGWFELKLAASPS
ncbi:MAG TPA: hypothetical protein VID68_05990 [Solirubrobacteraceae bacterium]